jgi:hypothetical protein
MADALQCTYEDARRNHLRAGIALSTAAKVDFFEEMVSLAYHFGARDRFPNFVIPNAVRDLEVASLSTTSRSLTAFGMTKEVFRSASLQDPSLRSG